MAILKCEALCKRYGSKTALENVNITVEPGRVIGLLGPNGSGKTTLIKLVNGLLQPTSGAVLINGNAPGVESKAEVSYLSDKPALAPWMNVQQLMDFFSDFYADFRRDRAEEMLQRLGIDEKLRIKQMSKGTKEKVQLILVMSRKAKLYLLDEPIAGVDPAAREYILRTIVSSYNPEGTIVITTHLIADVEQVLDDFMFLAYGGNIVSAGNAEQIRQNTGKSLDMLFREVFRC